MRRRSDSVPIMRVGRVIARCVVASLMANAVIVAFNAFTMRSELGFRSTIVLGESPRWYERENVWLSPASVAAAADVEPPRREAWSQSDFVSLPAIDDRWSIGGTSWLGAAWLRSVRYRPKWSGESRFAIGMIPIETPFDARFAWCDPAVLIPFQSDLVHESQSMVRECVVAGWPWPALRGSVDYVTDGFPSLGTIDVRGGASESSFIDSSRLAWFPRGDSSMHIIHAKALVPFDPLWGGLALNTLTWACVAAVVPVTARALRALRALLRASGDRCAKCGYTLHSSERCPECGSVVMLRQMRL